MKQFVNLNLFICIISLCAVFLTNNYTLKAQTDIACHVSIRCSFNIKIPNPLGGYEIKKTETYESYWERHPLNKNLHFSFDNMILPNTKSSSLKENQKLIIKTVEINVAETGTVTKTIHFGTCSENARWKKITISFFTFPSVEYFGEVQCVSNVKSRNYLIYINKDNDLYTKGKIEATYVEIANNTNFRNSHSCILPNHGKLSYKDFAGNKITESYRKKFYYRLKFKMKKIPGDGTPEKNNLYGPVRFVTFFPSLKFPNNTNVKVELPKCSYNNPIIKIPQSAKVDYAITIKKGNEYGHNYLTKDLDKKNGYFILSDTKKYEAGKHEINVEQSSGAVNTYCSHSSTFYIKEIPEFTISKPKYVFNGKDNNGKSVQIKKVNGLGTVNFSIAGSLEKDIEVYAGGLKIASRRLNNSYSKEGTTYYEGTIAIKFKAGVHKNIYVKNIECKSNKIESIELKEPDPIAFNIKTETISCHSSSIKGQKNNGKIIVSNIKGGIGKYDISINTDNCSINNNTIDGLTYKKEGYRLTIKDEKGNYTTKSVLVPQNKAIQFDIEKQTPPTMSCLKNGSITVSNPSGGAGQYKYSTAKDGHYTSSYLISGYYPGANKVFAIDKKLCVVSKSVDIPDAPPAISVKNREVTKPTCHGYNNGTYTATINNVVGNIKVESINPFINPKNISINGNTIKINKLYHGEYKIRITDNYNGDTCSISDSFSIDQKAAMKLSSIQIPVANKGTASGESTITLKTENIGTRKYYLFDYQYNKIDSIITNLNNAHFKKLKGSSENSGQIYYVNVVDNNNCSYYQDNESKYFSFHIKEPKNKLRINAKITDSIDCYGYNNGTVNLNAEGGWSEKAYIFSEDKINWSENNSFSGYSAGKQYFFVKDKNNGVDSIDVVFKQPKPLKSYLDSSLNVLCYNTNSGWARFKVTGGTYPYKFNEDINTITKLNEKDTLLTARKLYDGKYQFTIVDKNSCTIKTKTIAINEPSELKIPYKKIIHTSCELDNGQIHSCAKGGTEPYKYLWENSNKQTILEHKDYNTNDTSKLENIAADSYNLIVSDKNGCATKIENITIKPYTNPTFAEFKSVNAKCHNDKNGEIHVKAKKGTNQIDKFYNEALNHNYKKTNTTGIFKNLPVDNYSIYVYDNIGCKSNSPLDVTIKQPDPLMSVVKKIVPVKEKNSKSGQIHFFIKGGNSGLKTIQLIDSKQK
ncbi:MAG: hypothetical protein MI739_08925, partial [Bacteroidales bacterium]|nr:hypothetical protein [Bacteroidales bacterium]